MNLGNHLYEARKKAGLSQEEVAEKLTVSRQTISKWETNETAPDIFHFWHLAKLYSVTLDELMNYDTDVKEIEEVIHRTKEELEKKVNWTTMWGKKYPILTKYRSIVSVEIYEAKLKELLKDLEEQYHLNQLDSMLVLKDILYQVFKKNND